MTLLHWVIAVLAAGVIIFLGYTSMSDLAQPSDDARPSNPDYFLCQLIIVSTAGILFFLAYWNFSKQMCSIEQSQLVLRMMTIGLIVAAVLVCSILKLDPTSYKTIFAAIAGFVLGSELRRADPTK